MPLEQTACKIAVFRKGRASLEILRAAAHWRTLCINMREQIDNLRKETETTLRVLYALKQFRLFITKQEDVEKLNENADFWLIYESSLRTNLFVGIRRLYEGKYDTFNFHTFMFHCIKNVDLFSKESLRERKMAASANADEWIDDYMKDVYEPTEEDFKKL